jgi:hypothetical protein
MSLVVSTEDLDTLVKKWVLLDRQLKMIHEKTKEWREAKAQIVEKLSKQIEIHKLSEIETSEGKIRLMEKKEYTPLTYGFLETSLQKMIDDNEKVQQIISQLKKNREIKITKELVWK